MVSDNDTIHEVLATLHFQGHPAPNSKLENKHTRNSHARSNLILLSWLLKGVGKCGLIKKT